MKIATSLPAGAGRSLESLVRHLRQSYHEIQNVLNGGLQLRENLGTPFSCTFNVTANTAADFGHSLNRVPSWAWLRPNATPGGAVTFYWTDADFGHWTASSIRLRCTADTSGAGSLAVKGWVI